MTSLVRAVRPALAPFVETVWFADDPLPPGRERAVPTGTVQLVVNLAEDELRWYDGPALDVVHRTSGAGVCGALARPVGIDTAEQAASVGVAFRPGGLAPFVRAPVSELSEPVIAVTDVWGPAAASVRDRICSAPTPAAALDVVESFLLDQVVTDLAPDRTVAAAVRGLEGGRRVGSVVDDLGSTPSTLRRRMLAVTGFAPKVFARIRRVQRVLAEAAPDPAAVDWAAVAVRHGYADQSHLTNDLKQLTGLTPTAYRPRDAGARNHVPLTEGRG